LGVFGEFTGRVRENEFRERTSTLKKERQGGGRKNQWGGVKNRGTYIVPVWAKKRGFRI